jgi:hypothetical protein
LAEALQRQIADLFAQRDSQQATATAGIDKSASALVAAAVKIGILYINHMNNALATYDLQPCNGEFRRLAPCPQNRSLIALPRLMHHR